MSIQKDNRVRLLKKYYYLLKGNRTGVFFITGIVLILSIIQAFTHPKEWYASITVMPEEVSKSSVGDFGGLANSFGLSLPDGLSSALAPAVYGDILSGTDFISTLMEEKVYLERINDSITIEEFMVKYQGSTFLEGIVSLPSKFLGLMKVDEVEQEKKPTTFRYLDSDQLDRYKELRSRIQVYLHEGTGITQISCQFQDQYLTAFIANYSFEYLREYLREYTSTKEREKLAYLINVIGEKRNEYEEKQRLVSEFQDSNMGQLTNKFKVQLQNLQQERDLSFSVFSQLLKEKEDTELSIKRTQPVFKLIDPVVIPSKPSKPKKKVIVLFGLIFGFIFSTFVIIVRNEGLNFYKNLEEDS